MICTDFRDIPLFAYDLIMADPPWNFKTYSDKGAGKSARRHYGCMSQEQIEAMPVAQLAKPDCLLWLWVTNPMLPMGLRVMEAWGFTFKTAGHWGKVSDAGVVSFGTGYILRSAGEPYLIGTMGKPKTARNVRSLILAPRREHSRKPDKAFAEAERLMPDARRIELFSRQPRDGWDTWGNEARKFGDAALTVDA